MTAPALDQGYEQPPQTDDHVTEAVVALLVTFFASAAAIKAVVLPARLVAVLVSIGMAPKAARVSGRLALGVPMTGRSRYGSPVVPPRPVMSGGPSPGVPVARRVAADEPTMRARYVLNAARRLTTALREGQFLPAITTERRYLGAHVRAGRSRQVAAQALDEVAVKGGPWLRWVAVMDERTTPDCAALNGQLFNIDNPPGIPGAQHPSCRCVAVPAFQYSP